MLSVAEIDELIVEAEQKCSQARHDLKNFQMALEMLQEQRSMLTNQQRGDEVFA